MLAPLLINCSPEPATWALDSADRAYTEIPEALAAFCRPGPRMVYPDSASMPPTPLPRGTRAVRLEPIAHIYRGDEGSYPLLRCVIRSDAGWQQFWETVRVSQATEPLPAPAVDFDRSVVLVASMNAYSGRGIYDIGIDTVLVLDDSAVAVVWQTVPGEFCIEAEMPSVPMDIVRIPRTNRPVRFLERVRQPSCE